MTIDVEKYREKAAVAVNALRAALIAVEDCGADPELTAIVVRLSDDRSKLCGLFGLQGAQAHQWEKVDHIPSHVSPPAAGDPVYVQIDRCPYKVMSGRFTGRQIRAFAHPPITDDRDLWRVVPGDDDVKVKDTDSVDISTSGVRFFTAKKFINAG